MNNNSKYDNEKDCQNLGLGNHGKIKKFIGNRKRTQKTKDDLNMTEQLLLIKISQLEHTSQRWKNMLQTSKSALQRSADELQDLKSRLISQATYQQANDQLQTAHQVIEKFHIDIEKVRGTDIIPDKMQEPRSDDETLILSYITHMRSSNLRTIKRRKRRKHAAMKTHAEIQKLNEKHWSPQLLENSTDTCSSTEMPKYEQLSKNNISSNSSEIIGNGKPCSFRMIIESIELYNEYCLRHKLSLKKISKEIKKEDLNSNH